MSSLGLYKGCNMADQDMLNEVLGSAVSGRVIWKDALAKCAVDKTNITLILKHEAAQMFLNWEYRRQVNGRLPPGDYYDMPL